jgi:predicted transposase/invertase (TIGR01784 family)
MDKAMCLSPRIPYIFKELFGLEKNKQPLKSLVNAVLSPNKQLNEIALIYPKKDKGIQSEKVSVLYMRGIDEKGYHYEIEMEVVNKADYSKLILKEWSKFFNEELKESNGCDVLRKKIKIYLMNFNSFEEEEEYHHVVDIFPEEFYGSIYRKILEPDERLELHFIELEKFNKGVKKLRNRLDYWTYFIVNVDKYKKRDSFDKLFRKDSDLKEAFEVLKSLNLNRKEEEIYGNQLKLILDGRNRLKKSDYYKCWQKILIHLSLRRYGHVSSDPLSVLNELDEDLLGGPIDCITDGKQLDELYDLGIKRIRKRKSGNENENENERDKKRKK